MIIKDIIDKFKLKFLCTEISCNFFIVSSNSEKEIIDFFESFSIKFHGKFLSDSILEYKDPLMKLMNHIEVENNIIIIIYDNFTVILLFTPCWI